MGSRADVDVLRKKQSLATTEFRAPDPEPTLSTLYLLHYPNKYRHQSFPEEPIDGSACYISVSQSLTLRLPSIIYVNATLTRAFL